MIFGYLVALAFVVVTTISTLFIEGRLVLLGEARDLLFLALIISSLCFNLSGLKIIKPTYRNIKQDLRGYLKFCSLVTVTWICTVYGVQEGNAFLFNIFFFMTSAGSANLCIYLSTRKLLNLILLIATLVILFVSFITNQAHYVGIILSSIGGLFGYLYRKSSLNYAQKHSAGALEILMTRFFPVIIILAFTVNYQNIVALITNYYLDIIIFSCISFIIPTYLGQYATNKIGAEQTTLISALIFPLCWFGQLCLHWGVIQVNYMGLLIALGALMIIATPYVYKLAVSARC